MEVDPQVTWHEFNKKEEEANCPPPSLVPRLHCLYYNKLEELNPKARAQNQQFGMGYYNSFLPVLI